MSNFSLAQKGWISGAVAAVAITLSVAVLEVNAKGKPGGGSSNDRGGGKPSTAAHSSCRASAVRVDSIPLLGFYEPIIANDQEDPCVQEAQMLLALPPEVPVVDAAVLIAETDTGGKGSGAVPADASSMAVGAAVEVGPSLLPLLPPLLSVQAEVLESEAHVKAVDGKCVLSAQSSVSSALINLAGVPVPLPSPLITDHMDIIVPLVGTLHLNHTLAGANKITQRALWLEVTDPIQAALGLKDVVISEAIADFEGGTDCKEPKKPGDGRRMTGGGNFTDGTTAVTHHGFVLHCNKNSLPNRLQVNWARGNKFHLESLNSATCSDAPGIDPGQPAASFDTFEGSGSGRYNGVSGATATWTFSDAGEPGKDADGASLEIRDVNGAVVLTIQNSTLSGGNHQAHN